MKRRDMLSGGAALVFGIGIAKATIGWDEVRPQITHEFGVGTLHRSATRFIVGGLDAATAHSFFTRLITASPERQILTDAAVTDGPEALQRTLHETDFNTGFLLLVEARMSVEDRFGIYSRDLPEWIGWQSVSFPLYTRPWVDTGAELGPAEADQLIYTTVLQFDCESSPEAGRAVVYRGTGDTVRQRLSVSSLR